MYGQTYVCTYVCMFPKCVHTVYVRLMIMHCMQCGMCGPSTYVTVFSIVIFIESYVNCYPFSGILFPAIFLFFGILCFIICCVMGWH